MTLVSILLMLLLLFILFILRSFYVEEAQDE